MDGFAGLEARFDKVERVANYDACGARHVAGPEVGGHGWDMEGVVWVLCAECTYFVEGLHGGLWGGYHWHPRLKECWWDAVCTAYWPSWLWQTWWIIGGQLFFFREVRDGVKYV